MLHMPASSSHSSAFASRKDVPAHSAPRYSSEMPSRPSRRSNCKPSLDSAVLIVPLMNESHADLLMIPITDENHALHKPKTQHQHSPSTSTSTIASRTETPAAPTPAPKPQLPEGYNDWDSYLPQRKSTATLPVHENEGEWMKSSSATTRKLQSPELNFKHSFEQLGWRDCLNQKQRQKTNALTAKALPRIPSGSSAVTTNTTTLLLPLVYDASSPGNSSSGTSVRSLKRLSNASTLASTSTTPFLATTAKRLSATSTKTAASMPCYLPSTAYKRLSGSSTLTTKTAATVPCYISTRPAPASNNSKRLSNASTLTFASTLTYASTSTTASGKPRSIRRINRARHLRAYYSDGSLLRARRLSAGISSMQGIAEGREPANVARKALSQRLEMVGELCAPPPFPPPEKPLPSLPAMRGRTMMTTVVRGGAKNAKLPVVMEEVRELQTGERTRWREVLLRGLSRPRREASRRRAAAAGKSYWC